MPIRHFDTPSLWNDSYNPYKEKIDTADDYIKNYIKKNIRIALITMDDSVRIELQDISEYPPDVISIIDLPIIDPRHKEIDDWLFTQIENLKIK